MEIEDPANVVATRFVLLRHEMQAKENRQSHWDLMLEEPASLLTFELTSLPAPVESSLGCVHQARRLADHRREYLDYEGELSGGRGRVTRIASGEALRSRGVTWTNSIRYRLNSPALQAEFEFEAATSVHQRTRLLFFHWQMPTG